MLVIGAITAAPPVDQIGEQPQLGGEIASSVG
jgi:hypothetical protein